MMISKHAIQLHWHSDADHIARELANHVAQVLRTALDERVQAILAVSGGETPKAMFHYLSQQELDWSRVTICLVDERWVPHDSPHSNEALVRKHLLINAAAEATLLPVWQDHLMLSAGVQRYAQQLAQLPAPIDALVLGMGADGHTASLFPGMPGLAQALTADSPYCVAGHAPSPDAPERVSIGGRVILHARHCFLHVLGDEKNAALTTALHTIENLHLPDPLRYPISWVFQHRPVTVFTASTHAPTYATANHQAAMADLLARQSVIPVLSLANPALARPLIDCLYDAGMRVFELTLRHDAALEILADLRANKTDAIFGMGTVLSATQLHASQRAGAQFIVTPGLTPDLLDALAQADVPVLPGVATASELMQARERGYRCCKFFPAEAAGGLAMLKSFAGPFPDMSFCPTGGIKPETATSYLALANVSAVGGTWIAPAELVEAQNWGEIGERARNALSC